SRNCPAPPRARCSSASSARRTRRTPTSAESQGKGPTMSYFTSAEEVYLYLGGVFREANGHPEVGPVLKASGITLRLDYTGPESSITVLMKEPEIVVIEGECDLDPDVRLAMSADNGNKFWRGEYN